MKKLVAPEGWRISIKETKKAYHPEHGIHNYGSLCDDCGCVFVKRISKPQKSRPKKSLAQIAFYAFYKIYGLNRNWKNENCQKAWQSVADAVAREVRKRIKQQKEIK